MKGGTIWYHYTCRHNQKTAKSAPIDPKKGPAPLGVPPSVHATQSHRQVPAYNYSFGLLKPSICRAGTELLPVIHKQLLHYDRGQEDDADHGKDDGGRVAIGATVFCGEFSNNQTQSK